jgi:nucleoid-associated protein YgaU
MGVFDGKEGGSYSDPFKSDASRKSMSPDFSDTTSAGSSGTPSASDKADFSDVTSGQSSTAPAAPSGSTTYTVKSGDSLSKIAKNIYGDANKWHRIYDANRDKIKNPDLIHPGQEFTIPPDQK